MGTKVKGLLKGLRYISHVFDEEEEEEEFEIQIGLPTDVRHVGGHVANYESSTDVEGVEGVEDTSKTKKPKKWRRSKKTSSSTDTSPKKEKTRHSRRNHSKESNSTDQEGGTMSDSHAEVPKKSRRKKSKDLQYHESS